jgi:uroporphyrinogen-III synthase
LLDDDGTHASSVLTQKHAGSVRTNMTSILLSPTDAGTELSKEFARLGARVIAWPELSVDVPENCFALDEAIENLFGYDWLVLKNDRAAEYFLRSFRVLNSSDTLDQLRVLAIGETAAEQLIESQIHVDVALDRSALKSVFPAIEAYLGGRELIAGLNFLIPSAGTAREDFESQLEDAGARVDGVIAYRTTIEKQKLSQLKALLAGGGITCVAFTCTSTLEQLAQLFDTDDLSRLLAETKVSCLNSKTRDAATQFALTGTIIPAEPSIAAFANLIISEAA